MVKSKDYLGQIPKFTCSLDHDIRISTEDLHRALCHHLSGETLSHINQIFKLSNVLTRVYLVESQVRMRHCYEPFATSRIQHPYTRERVLAGPKETLSPPRPEDNQDLTYKELTFLSEFYSLLMKSGFKPLTHEEWQTAKQDVFTFDIPVSVDWSKIDHQLLPRLWQSTPDRQVMRQDLPEFMDRVLVCHRGTGVATAQGMYIGQKVDLLVKYLVVRPVARLLSAFNWFKMGPKGPLEQPIKVWQPVRLLSAYSPDASGTPPTVTPLGQQPLGQTILKDTAVGGDAPGKVVERRTLQALLPNVQAIITNFFRTMEIQEPTFRDVVVMYRKQPRHSSVLEGMKKLAGRAKGTAVVEAAKNVVKKTQSKVETWFGDDSQYDDNKRKIIIKMFEDVAVGDVEMVFPEKKVLPKPAVLLQLLVIIVSPVITFLLLPLQVLQQGLGMISVGLLWSVGSVALARWLNAASKVSSHEKDLLQSMVHMQYEACSGAQWGVVCELLDERAVQTTKEMLLLYCLMVQHGAQWTQEAVQVQCQAFLQDHFGQEVELLLGDSLARLEQWGLLTSAEDDKGRVMFRAVSLAEGVKKLERVWDQLYHKISDIPGDLSHLKGGPQTPPEQPAPLDDATSMTSTDTLRTGPIYDDKPAQVWGQDRIRMGAWQGPHGGIKGVSSSSFPLLLPSHFSRSSALGKGNGRARGAVGTVRPQLRAMAVKCAHVPHKSARGQRYSQVGKQCVGLA